jgi:phosphatidylglycerophosphate synthase
LAIPCHRLGLGPNTVSLLSFLTALIGVSAVSLEWVEGRVGQAVLLAIFLTISFGFDCADGMLARATGRSSSFGQLWDKLVDMATFMAICGILGTMALEAPFGLLPVNWRPFLFFWSVAPRCALTTFLWLKDSQVHNMKRLRAERQERSAAWKMKRLAGNLIDEPSFRFGLAFFWGLGLYWTFVLLYSTAVCILLIPYVLSTKKEMDARDREKPREDARTQPRQTGANPTTDAAASILENVKPFRP